MRKITSFRKIFLTSLLILLSGISVFAQKKTAPPIPSANPVKSTAAYAELLLRRAELESDIESFLESYTEEFSKVKEAKYQLALVNKDLARLLNETETGKLTEALGKLLVRKNELETEVWALQNQYNKEYPQVKRAQRKLLSFQNAIKEILP